MQFHENVKKNRIETFFSSTDWLLQLQKFIWRETVYVARKYYWSLVMLMIEINFFSNTIEQVYMVFVGKKKLPESWNIANWGQIHFCAIPSKFVWTSSICASLRAVVPESTFFKSTETWPYRRIRWIFLRNCCWVAFDVKKNRTMSKLLKIWIVVCRNQFGFHTLYINFAFCLSAWKNNWVLKYKGLKWISFSKSL